MDESKAGLYIVAVVGLVAVVAMVIMITGVSNANSGQAYRIATEDATGQAISGVNPEFAACVSSYVERFGKDSPFGGGPVTYCAKRYSIM